MFVLLIISESMKSQKIAVNKAPNSLKKVWLGATAFVALVATLAFSVQDGTLSKFMQSTGITSQNAASLWQPSQDNPYRAQLGANYSGKLDQLTIVILWKWKSLTTSELTVYLRNLSSWILALGNKPAYSWNQEVQNIIRYLNHELNDATTFLSSQGAATDADFDSFMAELDSFVDNN